MPTILHRIVESKHEEIARAQAERPLTELRAMLADAPPVRDFFAPLAAPGPIHLIAEVKKASPSKGIIRSDFHPADIARIYERHGAACLSVLTDEHYFHGQLNYLRTVRATVSLPVLRKDFVIDSYQVVESRVAGADAVLLIAECLDDCQLRKLHNEIVELGMTPLVEFYAPENLPRVLDAGATLLGVNNRDLKTFHTDLAHVLAMRQQVPENCVLVAESGIHSREDVVRLQEAGIEAMLVGERFMASPDIGDAVDDLLGK